MLMACFCSKLRSGRYSEITKTEAAVLKRVLEKAPQLFTAASNRATNSIQKHHSSSHKKRPRASYPNYRQAQQPVDAIQDNSQEQISDPIQPTIVQSSAFKSRDTTVQQIVGTVKQLEKTYSCQDIATVLKDNGGDLHTLQSALPNDVVVNIILILERSDQIIESKQLLKRVYCYALAKLHLKGTSVNDILQRVQYALGNVKNIKAKVYHYLRLGKRWETIVGLFESIFKGLVAYQSEIQLSGILCVLGTGSLWERSSLEHCQEALDSLCTKTDICEQVKTYSPVINGVLSQALTTHSFIHVSNLSGTNSIGRLAPLNRTIHTVSGTASHWKAPSTAAAAIALPGLEAIHSEDAKLLLVLLCFLASSKVPLDLLLRGASPRKRWNEDGGIEEMDACRAGLLPELAHLLSNTAKLTNGFCELLLLSAISRNSDLTYTLDEGIRSRILDSLPSGLHSFWRLQALIISYRSIPWKYIEPRPLHSMRELFIPHIQHTLQGVERNDGFLELPANLKTDLILTLVEASRLPNVAWKQFAVSQAKEARRGMNDEYLQSCITRRECLLYRITGSMDQAAHALGNTSPGQGQLQVGVDKRMHAGFGQTIIQRALNHIQEDELEVAKTLLDAWKPLCQLPSSLEEVVLFRKHVILGKISRFQGNFRESMTQLERSRNTADECGDLFFDEDRCDLVCNLADTFQELDDPVSAEHSLRTEIARQGQDCIPSGSLLKLALADSLFAQGRHDQVEAICSEVQSYQSLSKMGKLRLSIIRAKLSHVNSHWEAALRYWTEVMLALGKFTITNGHTTRIILLSICDVLRRQGQYEVELQSRNQLAALENLAGPAGVLYWIGGLRHWLNYLQSTNRYGSNRI